MDRVRALVAGRSVRRLEQAAGLAENRLAYYLKPGSTVRHIPSVETLSSLAHAIGCSDHVLFRAFAEDLGYPIRSG